jgi:hypothetical protein
MTISAALYQQIYDSFARSAVEQFNQDGELPVAFFGLQLDCEAKVVHMVPIPTPPSQDLVKPFLHLLLDNDSPLRETLAAQGAPLVDVIVQINEVWLANELRPAGETIDLTKVTPASERPDREEGIGILIHSATETIFGSCPILATPTRHAEYAPLIMDAHIVGRMSMNEDAAVKH